MSERDSANRPAPIRWDDATIREIRRDMLRFAQIQLRDEASAEDMVQEALIAAMDGAQSYDGRAAFKTWVFAILRNKIVDHIRRASRELSRSELWDGSDEGDERLDRMFDRKMMWSPGYWSPEHAPSTWSDPDAALDHKQFWEVFDACVNRLPERTARVYMMREFLELETEEICTQLGISANNCWVVLHRARALLRECLEHRWFAGEASA
jgi:RNA polymerase sigma-70 factor (ECF subfamily)